MKAKNPQLRSHRQQQNQDENRVLIPFFDEQEYNAALKQVEKEIWKDLSKDSASEDVNPGIDRLFSEYRGLAQAKLLGLQSSLDIELARLNSLKNRMDEKTRAAAHLVGLSSKRRDLMKPITERRKEVAENIIKINRGDEQIAREKEFQENHAALNCNGNDPRPTRIDKGALFPMTMIGLGIGECVVNFHCLQVLSDNFTNLAIVPMTFTLTAPLLIGAHFCGTFLAKQEHKIALFAGGIAVGGIAMTTVIRYTAGGDVILVGLNVLLGAVGVLLAYLRALHGDFFHSQNTKIVLENDNAKRKAFNAATEADCNREEEAIDAKLDIKAKKMATKKVKYIETAISKSTQLRNSIASFRNVHSEDINRAKEAMKSRYTAHVERSKSVRAMFEPEALTRLFPILKPNGHAK